MHGTEWSVGEVARRAGVTVRTLHHYDETGLLSPMGDAERLADALVRLLEQPGLAAKLAANGHRHIRENFRSSNTARAVEALYKEILPR